MRTILFWGICFLFVASSYGQTIQPGGLANLCQGKTLVLNIINISGSPTYRWMKNDTIITGATARTYTVSTSGRYTVIVTTAGVPDTLDPVIVTTVPLPVVGFNAAPNNQCGSVPVTFHSTATSTSPLSYLWNFGDPNAGPKDSAKASDTVHRFIGTAGNSTQTFNVRLTATDTFGCSANTTMPVMIKQSPDTRLGGTGATTYLGLPYFKQCASTPSLFNFTNFAPPNKISNRIIWGDSSADYSSATFTTTPHTYGLGTHTLKYIVTGSNGCIDTATYYVFVGVRPKVGVTGGANDICAGTTLTFSIDQTETSQNAIETIYTLTFNDKTPPITLPHPPPLTFSHTFDTTSCGAPTTGTYTNSFYFSVVASNACSDGESLYRPIYVSTKPVASFSVSPNDTTCVGTTVTFANTSFNKLVANGSCSDGNSVWSITPATGWAPTGSSDRGDDYGLSDPTSWKSGSKNLTINFTTPGTYLIKLKTGTGVCGIDSIVKTICVNPMPLASFTISSDTGCAPFQTTATGSTNSMLCGSSQYSWSVSHNALPGCLPGTSSFVYINNTGPSSANPQFRFINPGVYTISLEVKSPGNACSAKAVSRTVTVRSKATLSLTAATSVCAGKPFIPLLTAGCFLTNVTYAWSFPGGQPASSGKIRDTAVYNTPGSYNYSITATNGCGDTTLSRPLTVVDLSPAVADSTTIRICGNTTTLTAVKPATGTGTWSKLTGPGSPVIATPTSSSTNVTSLSAGTYTFQWRITNGACSSEDTVTVIVLAPASTAAAGDDVSLCNTASITFNGNTPVSGQGTWTLVSGPNRPTIVTPTSPVSVVNGIVPGEYIFRWTISNGTCTPSSDDVKYTISNTVTAAQAGPRIDTCGTTVMMRANTPAAGIGKWTRLSGPTSFTITDAANPTTTITNLTAGQYIFTWTITNGPCSSSANDTVVIAAGSPPANAGSDLTPPCRASSATLAGNVPAIGKGAWSLVSGPNTPLVASPNSSSTAVSNLVPGIYLFRWTVSFGNCTPNSDDVQVTIYDSPTPANAGPNQQICTSSATMRANTPAVGSGMWTRTSGPAVSLISNPSSATTTITGLVPGVYVFRWTISNGNCAPSDSSVTVTVAAALSAASAGADQSVCMGSAVSMAAARPVMGAGKWTLVNGPNTPLIQDAASPATGITGLVAGQYTFRWSVTNGDCPPSTDDVQINVVSLKSSFTPQDITTCSPDTVVLYNSSINYTGSDPVQRRWLIDNLAEGTGTTLTHHYTVAAGSTQPRRYNIWLVASTTTGGCSDTTKGTFTILPSVKASFDIVTSNTCTPYLAKMTNNSLRATRYLWLVNDTVKSTAASPELTIDRAATSYTIKLIAYDSLGCKPDTFFRTFTTPVKPKARFTLNDSLGCEGYLNVAVANGSLDATSYTWIWSDASANSNFTNPTHLYTVPGNYPVILIAANGTCTDTATARIQVVKKTIVDFTADKTAGCDSMLVNFTNLAAAGSYTWSFGDGTQSAQANPVKVFAPRTTPYAVKLVAVSTNGCRDSVTKQNFIAVTLPPVAGFTVSPKLIIEPPEYTFTFLNTTAQNANYAYTWNLGDRSLPVNVRDVAHQYADTGKYKVELTVLDKSTNCSRTVSQIVQITGSSGYLYIPNAFQPGSAVPALKTFLPIGKGLCSYRLQIFTTWGQKVFESVKLDGNGTPTEGWNGKYNGADQYNRGNTAQQDVYVWRIDAALRNGPDCSNPVEWKGMQYPNEPGYKRAGTITLVR